jgi:hypothetical protein
MTYTHRNPFTIEDLPYIVRVYAINSEGNGAATVNIVSGADYLYTRHLFQSAQRISRQFGLVSVNCTHSKVIEVSHGTR